MSTKTEMNPADLNGCSLDDDSLEVIVQSLSGSWGMYTASEDIDQDAVEKAIDVQDALMVSLATEILDHKEADTKSIRAGFVCIDIAQYDHLKLGAADTEGRETLCHVLMGICMIKFDGEEHEAKHHLEKLWQVRDAALLDVINDQITSGDTDTDPKNELQRVFKAITDRFFQLTADKTLGDLKVGQNAVTFMAGAETDARNAALHACDDRPRTYVRIWLGEDRLEGTYRDATIRRHRDEECTDQRLCDIAFNNQGNNLEGRKLMREMRSMSVGDLVAVNGRIFLCCMVGWKEINAGSAALWMLLSFRDRCFVPAAISNA